MDFTPIIQAACNQMWWVLAAIILAAVLRSPWIKGVVGELFVKIATIRLPSSTYHAIHNVTLPTPDGSTQIDHIFVSIYGVFVIETKNMKGWIFGSEKESKWTQKIYKKSHQFQNPLRQNYKHIKTLEANLAIPADTLQSVIAFTGEAEFKTDMPNNVTRGSGFISYIKSFEQPVLSEPEVQKVIATIQSIRFEPSIKTSREHVKRLKSNKAASKQCPKCGDTMVQRTAKRGNNAGQKFWGCSDYPKCKNTLAIEIA